MYSRAAVHLINACHTSRDFEIKALIVCSKLCIVIKRSFPVCYCSSLDFQKVAAKVTTTQQRVLGAYKDDLLDIPPCQCK